MCFSVSGDRRRTGCSGCGAAQTYVRLMVVKHRYGWGYETLVREVSDSPHLRRFCLMPLDAEVPTSRRPGS